MSETPDNNNTGPRSGDELDNELSATNSGLFQQAPEVAPPVEVPPEPAPVAEVPAEKPATASKENEPGYTLGNYKRLASATRFKIDGQDRPLYGRANFGHTPYKPRSELDKGRTPFAIPTIGFVGVASQHDAIQRLDFKNSPAAREWLSTIDSGMQLNPVNDAFISAMNREGSQWEQVPTFGERKLVAAKNSTPAHQNKELKEADALVYAMGALGLGTPVQAPMWHSGFWVSFRPASEDAWVNFNDRLTSDKINIGRNSSGLSFSNINAIFTERALEFALEHLLDHNIRLEAGTGRRDLFKKLRTGDIPAFLWAFLMANYPNGYPITRPCTSNIGTCVAVVEETINLRILQVTDMSELEERHRAHMAKNYSNGVSEKEVDEYQASLMCLQPREVTVMESNELSLRAVIAMPTAEEYILAGRRWFDGIVDMVNSVISKDATDNQREQTYQSYTRAAMMREYSHWTKELYLNTNVVKDLLTLEKLLGELTPHNELRKNFYDRISEYIERSALSVVAIPNYNCPACEKPQHTNKPGDRFVDCIPLDVAEAFFNLALLRMLEINRR